MDNAPIHISSNIKKAANLLNMTINLLPPYSPSLAPTEWMFGMTKKLISAQKEHKTVNFSRV